MKVLITGGTGFIGYWLLKQLKSRGYDIIVLSRNPNDSLYKNGKNIRFVKGDLKDSKQVKKVLKDYKPESLIHLAWEGIPDYSEQTSLLNHDITINLFRHAINSGCKTIISTGSCWEYNSRNGVQNEESPLCSSGIFPAVKNSIRLIGEALCKSNGVNFYWLRLFFVYGPGQREQSLIPTIIEAARCNQIPKIKTPENANDFIYVEDVARAIADVLEKKSKSTVYNIGSGISIKVADIIKVINSNLGNAAADSFANINYDDPIQDFWCDNSRISSDIGWKPTVDIEKGIIKTIKSIIEG